ncbi:uncharacterized protein BHQ10_002832 [Talaromyces amestolkiae]|uniref:BZIP domain-containing protein n=1 Tax=Talaromyces amestolkiae TaxID=1196081 RepID=A0A364KTD8_TALAM|nr:uncharacterized protein BHQ10_002832 [Talaromyces amestolkiae]RAO66820.1 hypothetical protein BHQ10_002832 [Talaromyces amestolkiae]
MNPNLNPASSGSNDLSHRSSLSGHRSSPQSTRPSISEGRRRSHLNLNDSPSALASAVNAAGGGIEHYEHRSPSFSNYFRTASPSSLGGSPIIATGDPHHQRAPSLGELHQELEQEQEAQVNRLLQMIRQQQLQLHQLQLQQQQGGQQPSSAIIDDNHNNNNNSNLTPSSERSHHQFPTLPPLPTPGISRSSTVHSHSHSPFSTRRGSRGSETAAPAYLQSFSAAATPGESVFDLNDLVDRDRQHDTSVAPARRSSLDDSAYYQAQVDSLNRDNRMLRARIRVLERQIAELHSSAAAAGGGGGAAADTETATAAVTGDGATHDEPAAEKNVSG